MATPIGHSLAGYAVYCFCRMDKSHTRFSLLLSIAMANAPDLDFLPGSLMGKPALFHRGITHSVGFALAASAMIAGGYRLKRKYRAGLFNMCLFSCLSHLVQDLMCRIPTLCSLGIPAVLLMI